jgi:hypothetical protein
MIGVFLTFGYEDGVDANAVTRVATAARAFFTPELTERVTGLSGVAPTIRYVQIAELVDNS